MDSSEACQRVRSRGTDRAQYAGWGGGWGSYVYRLHGSTDAKKDTDWRRLADRKVVEGIRVLLFTLF